MEESYCERIPNKTNDRAIVEAIDYFSPGALRILNHTVVFSFVFVLWFFFCVFSETTGKCPRNNIKTNNLCHTNH